MGSDQRFLIPLDAVQPGDEAIVGGKAAKLGRLAAAGFNVPGGFCLTTRAYEAFLRDSEITTTLRMELGRKPMDEMRWEEIWDAALRIRAAFLARALPADVGDALEEGLASLCAEPLAVRSSAIGEDSGGRSFAGLHESIIGVRPGDGVKDAVRLVWASLWSDAALLYRRELGLDPGRSRMAVLVQQMVEADRSGVAFARDPRGGRPDLAIVESVPGPCSLLVDGVVDPDRWEISRETRRVITWLPGQRDDHADGLPLLETADLEEILDTLLAIERLAQWAPDMEWTGRAGALTVLQARPITTVEPDTDEKRTWYLSLRPGDARLRELRRRVADELIPRLQAEGRALAEEDIDSIDDRKLAAAIEQRAEALARWKKIYWDEFIPFAHGIRRLATYYNDAVQPGDPYEFVGLLRGQPLLATERNRAIEDLARQLAANDALATAVRGMLEERSGPLQWQAVRDELASVEGAADFVHAFEELNDSFLDVAYDHERMHEQPEPLLRNLLELAAGGGGSEQAPYGQSGLFSPARVTGPGGYDNVSRSDRGAPGDVGSALRRRLLDAVGDDRREEALEMIETGRVSWKLRDDDNLLVARLESQLLRALEVAANRLRAAGRLAGDAHFDESHAEILVGALRDPSAGAVTTPRAARFEGAASPEQAGRGSAALPPGETPRQLIGQPASPGVASGIVRCIRGHADLGAFRRGEVLVCDAIQPTMTHLVPLASAIVERRGGMLIHGAIIARELGVPCVNGVRGAADILRDGDLVTVDGHLGIVTVGEAEFDLEALTGGAARRPAGAGGSDGSCLA